MLSLKGKVAIVTGASRGIGRAVALAIAKEGGNVVINYLDQECMADSVVKEITEMGCVSMKIQANVQSFYSVKKMVTLVKQRFGKIDILVNNAGIKRDHTVKNMSIADWHEVIDSDLTGIFNCTRCVLEIMIKQGFGNIVNVASIIGQTGNFGQANYAAAKAGVIGFTRSVAKEVANKGIRVNAVAPGFINTDFIKSIPEQTKNQILFNIPMKRFGEPFEVAKTILFLVSDDSSYLTGSVINVDGGYN